MGGMSDDTISINEAVALTGRTRSTIYNWIRSGRLPVADDRPHRKRLRRLDVLDAARIVRPREDESA